MTQHLTPLLNDLAVSVAAPAILLSDPDGQVRPGGVRGWFVDDVRLLDELTVSVRGSDLELVGSDVERRRPAVLHLRRPPARRLAPRPAGHPGPPADADRRPAWSRRSRSPRGPRRTSRSTLYVDLVSDLAPMAEVRQGHDTESVVGGADGARARPGGAPTVASRSAFDPAPDDVEAGRLVTWTATIAPGESFTVRLTFAADGTPALGPGGPAPWGDVAVEAPDTRLPRLVRQSLADLAGLLMKDGDDAFVAAGAPWFLTLFGRDSLWVARLLMPFSTDLALSTLRTLARRQGTKVDPDSEEQPGKILHEVRNTTLELGGMSLPPVYYGTVDATPLFVCTLADAWQWGADREQVAELLPVVRRCLDWVMEQSRESGWLRYVDLSGRGLANQGWKDSVDSVQFADGRLADPPIALSEVQGYAYEAAVRGSRAARGVR